MAWVKLDSKLHSHPKTLEAGLEGIGLYVLALTYCGDHLSDGFIPASWVEKQAKPRVIARVTAAGLWRPVAAGELLNGNDLVARAKGYYVRDYTEWNTSRAEVLAAREAMAAGGRKGMQKRWKKGDEDA